MHTELFPLDRLTPYEHNPRINDQAVDAAANSIHEFGFRQPIVVDPDGVVIADHTRFKAAQRLGLTEVPVHVKAQARVSTRRAGKFQVCSTSVAGEPTYESTEK